MLTNSPSLLSLIIYFIYGFAFFVMGISLVLESIRSSSFVEIRLLYPLAVFGILHGIHEWFEFFLMQATWLNIYISEQLFWIRMVLLAISFIALGLYGLRACQLRNPDFIRRLFLPISILGIYILVIIANWSLAPAGIERTYLTDNLIRYLLAVPAAMLTSLGLNIHSKDALKNDRQNIAKTLKWAAIGFGMYGLSQLFVTPLEIFPANIINKEFFISAFGLPVEVLRTVFASISTIAIIKTVHIVEQDRQEEFINVQRERVYALEQAQEEIAARQKLQQELLLHTVQVQEDERTRISRELHDETAQVLSAFSLELAALQNRMDDGSAQLAPSLDRLQELSKDMSQGIYRLVHDLRPAQLDDLGLVAAIQNLIGDECCKMDLQVSLEIEGKSQRMNPLVETVLFRVAQAALTNVARHAQTTQANVQIQFSPEQVVMHVEDQGVGFDPQESFAPPQGWGLEGMKERIEGVSGEFSIESEIGKGTRVTVIIPCVGKGNGVEA